MTRARKRAYRENAHISPGGNAGSAEAPAQRKKYEHATNIAKHRFNDMFGKVATPNL